MSKVGKLLNLATLVVLFLHVAFLSVVLSHDKISHRHLLSEIPVQHDEPSLLGRFLSLSGFILRLCNIIMSKLGRLLNLATLLVLFLLMVILSAVLSHKISHGHLLSEILVHVHDKISHRHLLSETPVQHEIPLQHEIPAQHNLTALSPWEFNVLETEGNSNILPWEVDVLLTDVTSSILRHSISPALGYDYLASWPKNAPLRWPLQGIIYGRNSRLVVCAATTLTPEKAMANGVEAMLVAVHFIVDTSSPFSYLSEEAVKSLADRDFYYDEYDKLPILIHGARMKVHVAPSKSRFRDVCLIGADFLEAMEGELHAHYGAKQSFTINKGSSVSLVM